ncbi:sigma-54-dependent transcriptional regulator [Candidatus Protochlamydia phocaeensis]|uniref:sigma-54-dependent transcriptional regulator n=1 Tax=Candidatus Protochlamydia phocaeensis TaxID=1414722 RepID=UPI000838B48B|nr:sigma-54 dependent transcriptional regulator [Candidatus Protochlamydia phocaeensis]
MSIEKILVVDDELLMRNFLVEALKRKNIEAVAAENGEKAVKLLQDQAFDMVITDMKMPGLSGMDVLRKVKELSPRTLVIVITAFGTIENAVEAMKAGAFHYLIKPFSLESLLANIEKANQHVALVEENDYLREQVAGNRYAREVIAESPAMKQVLKDIERIAKSNANVFINGETGTGKEVIAHVIHYSSPRANQPFIKVNCAAVPETLVESEFFGHEKGAFTGASTKRLGRFELANGGSLLLDEITEIPLVLQAKLLRVTQEQEFERVGGSKPIKVDVRLISTSNRDMKEAIASKVLREDLYYRLNVVPIYLPPLRERREDIIPLAEHFMERMCRENHLERKRLSTEAQNKLLQYRWPGNVRELANVIERSIVMDPGKVIQGDHLYLEEAGVNMIAGKTIQELEKQLIVETLQMHQNRTKAAETLGISLKELRSKLQEYNLT